MGGWCGVKLGLIYVVNPKLSRYSRGLSEPRDIWIRFSFYQRILAKGLTASALNSAGYLIF